MCEGETRLETEMQIRVLEADGFALVTVDGPFESRTFRIPTEDAPLFAIGGTLDCRAIIFQSDRGGGHLRALYPWLHGEWQVRYDLRELCRDSSSPVATIVDADEEMPAGEIERGWTVVWESDDENEDAEEQTPEPNAEAESETADKERENE